MQGMRKERVSEVLGLCICDYGQDTAVGACRGKPELSQVPDLVGVRGRVYIQRQGTQLLGAAGGLCYHGNQS